VLARLGSPRTTRRDTAPRVVTSHYRRHDADRISVILRYRCSIVQRYRREYTGRRKLSRVLAAAAAACEQHSGQESGDRRRLRRD